MILDKLSNLASYAGANDQLRLVSDYIDSHDLHALPDGKIEVDGDRLYLLITHNSTEPWEDRRFEAHHNYLDVQCVLAGREAMGYANIAGLKEWSDYDPNRDIVFYSDPPQYSTLAVTEGMFAVFLPEDAHKPCCVCTEQMPVHKVVFKVKL